MAGTMFQFFAAGRGRANGVKVSDAPDEEEP
jgi:hypothetical protein